MQSLGLNRCPHARAACQARLASILSGYAVCCMMYAECTRVPIFTVMCERNARGAQRGVVVCRRWVNTYTERGTSHELLMMMMIMLMTITMLMVLMKMMVGEHGGRRDDRPYIENIRFAYVPIHDSCIWSHFLCWVRSLFDFVSVRYWKLVWQATWSNWTVAQCQ